MTAKMQKALDALNLVYHKIPGILKSKWSLAEW